LPCFAGEGYNNPDHKEDLFMNIKPKKILVVDDEKSVTDILKLSLEKTGEFRVRAENKGSAALAAAREFKPDLILLDVMMPDMDGGEVAGRIKKDTVLKGVPILFLTAAVTQDEIESQDNRIGGYPFIAKPVTIDELVASIKKHLR
jgi:DNA-binding response OmpR family regulator